jgi:hypothetical protein
MIAGRAISPGVLENGVLTGAGAAIVAGPGTAERPIGVRGFSTFEGRLTGGRAPGRGAMGGRGGVVAGALGRAAPGGGAMPISVARGAEPTGIGMRGGAGTEAYAASSGSFSRGKWLMTSRDEGSCLPPDDTGDEMTGSGGRWI